MTAILGLVAFLAGQPLSTADELARIEQRILQTWLAGDRAGYSDLLTDDWTTIDMEGRALTKPQVLQQQFGPPVPERPPHAAIEVVHVRLLGDCAAIVNGVTTVTFRDGSKLALRFTDVFYRRTSADPWRAAASQGTRIAEAR